MEYFKVKGKTQPIYIYVYLIYHMILYIIVYGGDKEPLNVFKMIASYYSLYPNCLIVIVLIMSLIS